MTALLAEQEDDLEPLPVHVAKTRRCLACHKDFPSHSAANRICTRCRRLDTWQAGITEYPF
jgi:hypothetical protein